MVLATLAVVGAGVAAWKYNSNTPKPTHGFPEIVANALRDRGLLGENKLRWQKDSESLECGPLKDPKTGLKGKGLVYEKRTTPQDLKQGQDLVTVHKRVVLFVPASDVKAEEDTHEDSADGKAASAAADGKVASAAATPKASTKYVGFTVDTTETESTNFNQAETTTNLNDLKTQIARIVKLTDEDNIFGQNEDEKFIAQHYQGHLPDDVLKLLEYKDLNEEQRWRSVRIHKDNKSSTNLYVCYTDATTLSSDKFVRIQTTDDKKRGLHEWSFKDRALTKKVFSEEVRKGPLQIIEAPTDDTIRAALDIISKVPNPLAKPAQGGAAPAGGTDD